MQFGKSRKWNFNFPGTLSAAWIICEPIASLSLFLTEERLLWKLTRREMGWHSTNIRCINENLGFLIARCGFRILCCWSGMVGTGFNIPCPWNVDSRLQSLARFQASYIEQAPAVQKLDNAIHRINLYPVDRSIDFANTYPEDSAIHLMNNRVWIPNFKPLNWFRISLQEKNSRVPVSGLPYT